MYQRSQVELSFLHPVPDFPDPFACPSHRECIIFVSRLPMLFSTPKIVLPFQLHKLWTSHACIRLVYCYSILLEGQEIQSCQVWFWLIFQEKRVQMCISISPPPLSQPLAARPSCGPWGQPCWFIDRVIFVRIYFPSRRRKRTLEPGHVWLTKGKHDWFPYFLSHFLFVLRPKMYPFSLAPAVVLLSNRI